MVDWLTTEQSLLSNLTIVRAVFEKFSPVKVTVSPPRTEPNRGQILVRRGVEALVKVTGVREVETVPITTFGVQVKLSVWSAKDYTPVSLNSVTRQDPLTLPMNL